MQHNLIAASNGGLPAPLYLDSIVSLWIPMPGETYQQSDGTVPASVGDPVGYLRDLNENTYPFAQDTTANKPILRKDEENRYYLEFDKIDDYMLTLSTVVGDVINGTAHLFIVSYDETAGQSGIVFHHGDEEDPNFQLRIYPSNVYPLIAQNTSNILIFRNPTPQYSATGEPVLNATEFTGSSITQLTYRREFSGQNLLPVATATIDNAPNNQTSVFSIGARPDGSFRFGGRIYGIGLFNEVLTGNEFDDMRVYFSNLGGIPTE